MVLPQKLFLMIYQSLVL